MAPCTPWGSFQLGPAQGEPLQCSWRVSKQNHHSTTHTSLAFLRRLLLQELWLPPSEMYCKWNWLVLDFYTQDSSLLGSNLSSHGQRDSDESLPERRCCCCFVKQSSSGMGWIVEGSTFAMDLAEENAASPQLTGEGFLVQDCAPLG